MYRKTTSNHEGLSRVPSHLLLLKRQLRLSGRQLLRRIWRPERCQRAAVAARAHPCSGRGVWRRYRVYTGALEAVHLAAQQRGGALLLLQPARIQLQRQERPTTVHGILPARLFAGRAPACRATAW